MIDIKLIRDSPELVRENITRKFKNSLNDKLKNKLKILDNIIKNDNEWRKLKSKADELRAERNSVSKEIAEAIKQKKDVKGLMKKAKDIPYEISKVEEKAQKLRDKVDADLIEIPNIMHSSVPIGKDDSENKVVQVIGKPGKFNFELKNHAELAESLGIADFDSSAKTSGNGFYYLQGDLALLNQALIRFAIDSMVKAGFEYIETPLMLRSSVINNVTDLNDQKNQIYKINDEDLYLIGTSEHSLIGRYIDSILNEKDFPIKQASYSMCFRKEIGAHGIDEKGLFRTHQFNKVEMISICKPSDSMDIYQEMQKITIKIFKDLGIPIRVLAICSGDLGDLKHVQIDIEAYSPRKENYFEVASCSNLTDAQARRLKIRADGKEGRYIPHTLNNTAIATSRAMVAILENYQQKDGTIKVPEVLLPYMYGKKFLGKK